MKINTLWLNSTSRLAIAFTLLSHLCSIDQVSAQTAAAKNLEKQPRLGDPVVLFVCFEDYKHEKLEKLTHPVANGIALAKEMQKQGYRVTFITDRGSLDRVNEDLQKLAKVVLEANNAIAIEKALIAWIDENFLDEKNPAGAPMGFIVLCGHGEERDPDVRKAVTYLLTPDDAPGKGGYRIQDIQQRCADHSLPITMIVDVCRTVKDLPEEKIDEAELKGFSPSVARVIRAHNKGWGVSDDPNYPTTLWAVPKGVQSPDSANDLIDRLATGLHVINNKTFVAGDDARKIGRANFPPERAEDLSLQTWFHYANTRIDSLSERQPPPRPQWGKTFPQMIIATTDVVNRARLFQLNRQIIDLINLWEPNAGNLKADKTSQGIIITRPKGVVATTWQMGLLSEHQSPTNKVLVCECVARSEGVLANSKKNLSIMIQPTNGRFGEYFASTWNKPVKIPYNEQVILKIPLDTRYRDECLRLIAFAADSKAVKPDDESTWPEGASVTITRMYLVDGNVAKSIPVIDGFVPVEVVPRWWLSDIVADKGSKAKLYTSYVKDGGNKLLLNLRATDAEKDEEFGRAGTVFPKVFVDKSINRVELRMSDCGLKTNTRIIITMLGSENKVLAHRRIEVAPENVTKPIFIDLDDSDFLEYIAVTTDDPNLKAGVRSLAVVAKELGKKK